MLLKRRPDECVNLLLLEKCPSLASTLSDLWMNDCILSSTRSRPSLPHTKKNWLSEQACQFSFISVCLVDLTRKRMLIQLLGKGHSGFDTIKDLYCSLTGQNLNYIWTSQSCQIPLDRRIWSWLFPKGAESCCIVLRWHLLTCSLPWKVFASIRSWRAVTAASR